MSNPSEHSASGGRSGACPTEDELSAFVQGFLAPAKADAIEAHLDSCPACTSLIADAARELIGPGTSPAVTPSARATGLTPGERLGRYSILELIGKGAMGAVYAAYDPQLDRRVALKLVRPELRLGVSAAELQARLLREAQAMARLAHPNVLPVYDAGTFEDGVFIALEFASGGTLRRWLAEKKPGWEQVLSVFRQAGAGLAAAHRAGIVHRDFKPDNVLLDPGGRALITDFGVALAAGTASEPGGAPMATRALSLTGTGALVGTPAYMAPEQFNGQRADARSDLFAFCAALYEALYQVHPFPLDSPSKLREAVCGGQVRPPPPGRGVPRRIEAAVLRGLAVDPARRFANMEELLAALEIPGARAPWALAAAGVGVIAAVALLLHWRATRQELACERGDGRGEKLWDAPQRLRVEKAFVASGAAFAPETWERVTRQIDSWSAGWSAARKDACSASRPAGPQSETLVDRRLFCLDERLQDAEALIAQLARADASMVEKSVAAVDRLEPASVCADRHRLLDPAPLPSDSKARAVIAAAHEKVAALAALDEAGRYQEGVAQAAKVVEEARAAGYAPVEAEALLDRGVLLAHSSDLKTAEGVLIEAAAAATRGQRDDLVGRAESWLVWTVGSSQRTEEASRWGLLARASIARAGDDPLLLAGLFSSSGAMHNFAFQHQLGLADYQQALALLEKSVGPTDPRVVDALSQVQNALYFLQRYQESLPLAQRALALSEQVRGPFHPQTASAQLRIGLCLEGLGRYREALEHETKALELRRRALGPEHGDLARSYGALGNLLTSLGRYDDASAAFRSSVAIAEKRFGPSHIALLSNLILSAWPLALAGRFPEAHQQLEHGRSILRAGGTPESSPASIGNWGLFTSLEADVLEAEGRFPDATRSYNQARAWLEKSAPGSTDVAHCKNGQGRQLLRSGKAREAAALHAEALREMEKSVGASSAELDESLIGLGDAERRLSDLPAARAWLERGLGLLQGKEIDPLRRAELQLAAASVLASIDGEKSRALKLGEEAEALLGARPLPRRLRDRLEGWKQLVQTGG